METQQELKVIFDQKVKEFDKYFEFSDDSEAYNNGKAQLIVLRSLARQCNISNEEYQMEPLKGRLKDHIEDVVAKEIHSEEIKKQVEYYIEHMVKEKIKEYFNRETEKEHMMKTVFADELKDL
jgi:hypothetical protein